MPRITMSPDFLVLGWIPYHQGLFLSLPFEAESHCMAYKPEDLYESCVCISAEPDKPGCSLQGGFTSKEAFG